MFSVSYSNFRLALKPKFRLICTPYPFVHLWCEHLPGMLSSRSLGPGCQTLQLLIDSCANANCMSWYFVCLIRFEIADLFYQYMIV